MLLITHSILEAEKAVDRLAMIDLGKVLGLGTSASFKEHDAGFMRLELVMEPTAKKPDLPEFLSKTVDLGSRLISSVSEKILEAPSSGRVR